MPRANRYIQPGYTYRITYLRWRKINRTKSRGNYPTLSWFGCLLLR